MSFKPYLRRRELEGEIDLMPRFAREIVHDDPVAGLNEDDAPAVGDGVGQPHVTVMLGIDEVEIARGMPLPQPDARTPAPAKGSGGLRLTRTVDHHRAVRGGAAEEVAP